MAVETIRAYGMVSMQGDVVPAQAAPPAPAYVPPPPPAAFAPAPPQPAYQRDTAPAYGYPSGTFVPIGAIPPAAPAPQATSIWAQLSAAINQPAGGPSQAGRYVPYINQYTPANRDYGYTNGNANCGPTSVAMIARAVGYGSNLGDAQLINYLGSVGKTTSAGTSVNGIAAMAQAMGLPAEIRGPSAQVGWIADQLRAGRFVVANGDYFAMRPHEDPSRTSGHYVLITGIDAQGYFQVLDPADANSRMVTEDELRYYISSNRNGGYQIAVG